MPKKDQAVWMKGMQAHAARVGYGRWDNNDNFHHRDEHNQLARAIIGPIYTGPVVDPAYWPYWYNQYNYLWDPYLYWNRAPYTYNEWLRYTQPLYDLGYVYF